jgi:subtilase family serine protease
MKTKYGFVLFFIVMIVLSGAFAQTSYAASVAKTPPKKVKPSKTLPGVLEVQRVPAFSGGEIANVAQPQIVHDIYQNVLSLPKQAKSKICPMYIAVQYQLTFLHGGSSILMANVQQGGCATVSLGHGDIRTPTKAFWALLTQAHLISNVRPAVNAPGGLGPNDLQNAYRLPSTTAGSGQTVAIVDANDDPNAEKDMATYRSTFGLPACRTSNGCFKKVDQNGGTRYPQADQGWSGEISLDLDMVSAVCPNCHILLVEANTASFSDLGAAVNTAVRLKANAISNSYGASEDGQTVQYAASYYNHPGVVITASAGDNGYGVELPASFKTVVAVGGTSLSRASNSRGWTESAWNGTGSGCSQYVSKPQWQVDRGCNMRTVSDVSAIADPATGVAVYNTYGGYGWAVFGGTSASSPIIASTYALAGNASKVGASYLYSHTASLNPVTSGSNGYCNVSYLCNAGVGYNGPTGLGTPDGVGAF